MKKVNLYGKKVEFSLIWFVSVEGRVLCRAVLNTCILDLVPRVMKMGENCVFSILHTKFDINVIPKIKCLLLKLGYSSFRTLPWINPDCAELENFLRSAVIDYVADLSEAERISIFRDFWKIPSKFSFMMPGEKALIADVVDPAQKNNSAKSRELFLWHFTVITHQDAKERERLPSVHQCQREKK